MRQTIKPLITLLFLSLMLNSVVAQKKQVKNKPDGFNQAFLGFGFGFDYGGIGIKAEFLPSKYLGLFGGVGYNLVEPAYNIGLSAKILPGKILCPFLIGMYGYNAALRITNASGGEIERKNYYGITVGAGVDIRWMGSNNKISIALLAPFREPDFQNTYNRYERNGSVFSQKPLPVAFSIGFNFAGSKK